MPLQDLRADGERERLDRRRRVFLLAHDAMDQILDGFAGHHRLERPFEPQANGQILRIVAVAAPEHAEHAQARLAVAAT